MYVVQRCHAVVKRQVKRYNNIDFLRPDENKTCIGILITSSAESKFYTYLAIIIIVEVKIILFGIFDPLIRSLGKP